MWVEHLRPEALGGRADYIIVSGRSMLPTLQGGDLVAVRRQSSYATGDLWHPRPSDIVGKLWFRVPATGRVVAFVRTPTVIAATAAGFAFAFAFTWQPRRREPESEPEFA